jgi:CelD/BcsL family acetyltransferase involved in cellulose biosynthesis
VGICPGLYARPMSAARWTTLAELEDRSEELLRLAAESEFPSIFADPRWVSAWWRHYGDGSEPWVLVLEDSSGALRGLATLACQGGALGRTLSFAGGRWNGFDTPLSAAGAEEEVAQALLGALAERRREWELWRIGRLPRESALARALLDGRGPLRAGAHDIRLQPFVPLPDEVDAFESRYSGKRRTEFRRRWRRLLEQGAEGHSITDPGEADARVRRLLELRRERAIALGQPYAHMDERFERFAADVVGELLPGAARLWMLELGGELLAAKLDFVAAWREHSYISAVSDKQLPLGPGHSLERQAIHAMISEGRRELDFGPGRDSYKYHWGAVDRKLARILVASSTPRGRLAGAPAGLDLRLRNTSAAEALRRRRGVVPERATAEMPAREANAEVVAADDG